MREWSRRDAGDIDGPAERPSKWERTSQSIKTSRSERSLIDAVITASRDERGCNEMARCVQHRGENVGERVDCDQDPDSFGRQTDGEKEWCQHDERAARNARHGERKEDGGESDRGNAAGGEGHVIEPADEKRADRP